MSEAVQGIPIAERISGVIQAGKVELPPLDTVAIKLMDLLADEDRANANQVAHVVKSDPAVAAAVLKLSNSAAFGGLTPVADLTQAVSRLGLTQVRSVVTALSAKKVFQSKDPAHREVFLALWRHSIATATAAKRLATLTGGVPEESFLAGLLHDVGKLFVLVAFEVLKNEGETVEITPSVLAELMDAEHASLGNNILKQWRVPDDVADAVLNHHREDVSREQVLTIRVQAADVIARKIGAHPIPEPSLELAAHASIDALDLTEVELAAFMVDLEDEISIMTAQYCR